MSLSATGVVEADGSVVTTGGAYYHYNPPYGDIFMEVSEPARRQGFGSYLVQEVKRVCYETGKKPAARCAPEQQRFTQNPAESRIASLWASARRSSHPARLAKVSDE